MATYSAGTILVLHVQRASSCHTLTEISEHSLGYRGMYVGQYILCVTWGRARERGREREGRRERERMKEREREGCVWFRGWSLHALC